MLRPWVGTVSGVVLSIGVAGTAAATAPPVEPLPDPPTPFVHPADAHDPNCVIEIQPGSSLSLIAEAMPDTAVTYSDLARENGITNPDQINAGAYLDICVGNGVNDVTGGAFGESGVEIVDEQVAAQQRKLNALFAGTGFRELLVDGISGPITRRHLCVFRSIFGLPTSRADLVPGSAEEQFLMSQTGLPAQPGAPEHWVVIDKTCQTLVAGERDRIVFVFQASTGEAGYETRNQNGVRAFRYNPAAHNNGWHDSTTYPSAADNPLNGNMYKPIYFDRGQAIHGSYNVPPTPQSKGCVRLLPEDQDRLISWLGLGDVTSAISGRDRINLKVHVQGDFGA